MAGLLDAFGDDNARFSLGLLAAAGPRFDGANEGQRLQEALGGFDAYKQNKAKADFLKMQQERQKKEWATQDKEEALAPQFYRPAAQATAPILGDSIMPPELQAGILPSAGTPSRPASFDMTGYTNAMMSVNPSKGIALLQSMAKDTPFNKVDPKDYTPESLAKFGATRDYASLVPRVKKEVSDGVVYDPYAVQTNTILPNPNKPFMSDGKGGVVPNLPFQKYEIGKARAGATNVSLSNVGPKAFETELGKMDAEQLGKWREGAQAAQSTLGSVQRLESADAKGAYSGGAANLKMTVGSYINGLTGATPKGQVGSELYTAEANNLVISQVKALGANPSNADVIFIKQTVPQLSTNAEARTAMTEFMRRKAEGAIGLYQRANTHARKNSGLGGFEVVEPTSDIDALLQKYNK